MEIQKILFPKIGRCTEQELYFRKPDDRMDCIKQKKAQRPSPKKLTYHYSEGILHLKEGERAAFDTYFNGFSIEKWKKYTVLDNLSLCLTLQGNVKVTLISRQKIHEYVSKQILSETIINSLQKQEYRFTYEIQNARGMLTFEIEACKGGGTLYAGGYHSEVTQNAMRRIKIGVGICTFRREDFLKKNLRILSEELLENKNSPLYGNIEVHVSDNGCTLDAQAIESSNLYIYANKNLGGSGGFTRCMVEMKKKQRQHKITHILLMDDDVVIEPEALIRTYWLLALAKDTYTDAFIGGAMLRMDRQAIQTEAGAVWNQGALDSLKKGLDMRSCEACLVNETEEYAQFHAWWYCCFPLSMVTASNLPLPLFIRGDDVEYGLRNMKHLIMLNGICVWHEPFENKYSSSLEYYIIRNQLIVNAFHCPQFGARQLNKCMLAHCLREITYYRYKNVDLYLQGIRDFLKGPQWLMRQDAQALHQKVMEAGYQAQDMEKLDMGFHYPTYEASRNDHGQNSTRCRRLLTLNGLLLPSKGDSIAPMVEANGAHFYRKKHVMNYDALYHRGFITTRSLRKSLQYIVRMLQMMLVNVIYLKQAQKAYQKNGKYLRTWGIWKNYFGQAVQPKRSSK